MKNGDKRNLFLSSLSNIILIILIVITIISVFLAPYILKIVAPGFNDYVTQYAVIYTKWLLPMLIFSGITYISMAYLQFSGYYNASSLMGFSSSIVCVITVLLFHNTLGMYSLVLGTFVGSAAQFFILIPYLRKYKYKYKFNLTLTSDHRRMLAISSPVLLSSFIIQINITVDRILASNLPSGSISALNYAARVNTLLIGTIIMGLSAVIFPLLSKYWAEQNELGVL